MFNSFLVKYVAIFFVIMDVLYIAFGHFMLIPMEDIFMGKKSIVHKSWFTSNNATITISTMIAIINVVINIKFIR